jgi:XTP/dITP diphosphohydrolase
VEWIVATRSHGKWAELVPLLAAHGIQAIGLDDAGVVYDPEEAEIERFDTFEENALAKARYFAAKSQRPCLADDSGLCIDALGGRPGVRSRRFAIDASVVARSFATEAEANNHAMLDACQETGVRPPWPAHYACAAAYADAARSLVACGRSDGAIVPAPVGAGGFGYDPYFFSADLGVTFAEASRTAKARVSHRGRAVAALLARIAAAESAGSAR